ncbi:MAG: YbhB/YbcL family Raf kinase inhibitor-like protein [Planctomycetota bacterium]
MTIKSTAFADGEPIPRKHTGDGEDVSSPLSWSELPEGTKELALIMDDPDAPGAEPWVHWVIYKIPAEEKGLQEGLPTDQRLSAPAGALQGKNSWPSNNIGYRGPSPPAGRVHHYHFKLYALDSQLDLQPGLTKNELLKAMGDHVLASAELVGTYKR